MKKNSKNDFIKKILLHMKYDSTKTLSENKEFIFEDVLTIPKTKNTTSPFGQYCAGKNLSGIYLNELIPLNENWEHTYLELDNIEGQDKTENRIGFVKRGEKKYSACLTTYNYCTLNKFYQSYPELTDEEEKNVVYNCCMSNNQYDKVKLTGEFQYLGCNYTYPRYLYIAELDQKYHSKTISLLEEKNVTYGEKGATNKKPQTPIKDVNQIKKEKIENELEIIKNDPDAPMLYPKDYAKSKGMTEWKDYKELFCCPKTGSDGIKCNQNIGIAISKGWTADKPVPSELSWCSEKDSIDSKDEFQSEFGFDNDLIDF